MKKAGHLMVTCLFLLLKSPDRIAFFTAEIAEEKPRVRRREGRKVSKDLLQPLRSLP
jgi:hypothetical protein